MEEQDITKRFRAMLADLYPGEAIEAPSAVVIGGEAPGLTIDFGIVKEDGRWRVPDSFRHMVDPVLLREAFRAGFPAKTAKAPSMIHACNWFAWKSIADRGLRKKFMDTWIAASMAETKTTYPYTLPPVWIQEIDKAMDIDPRELHGLLVGYAAENERLLGKQLRYDATELWAYNRAVEQLPVPDATLVELLFSHTRLFLETKDLPRRGQVIDDVMSHQRFGSSQSVKNLDVSFSTLSSFAFLAFQLNISLIDKRYLFFLFVPTAKYVNLDWATLFQIPGMLLSVHECQGSLLSEGNELDRTYVARFLVPTSTIDSLIEFLSNLAAHGFFASHRAYICDDGYLTVNYNTYIPFPKAPAFTVNPVRNEKELFLHASISYSSTPGEASDFLSNVAEEGLREVRAFVDKVCSTFSVSMARYDSWMTSIAQLANISEVKAKRWFDLFSTKYHFFIPEPRCSYLFNPHVPAFSRLFFTTRANITDTDRARIALMFPSSFSSILRGIKTPDVLFWSTHVPRGQLHKTIQLLNDLHPESHHSLIIRNPILKTGMMALGWFDGHSYEIAAGAIQHYAGAVSKLSRGDYTLSQYQNEVIKPAEEMYRSL